MKSQVVCLAKIYQYEIYKKSLSTSLNTSSDL